MSTAPLQRDGRGSQSELTSRAAVGVDASSCLRPAHSSLRIHRETAVEGPEATITWTLSNQGRSGIEIGGLGFSMPFNQMFTGRSLPQALSRARALL